MRVRIPQKTDEEVRAILKVNGVDPTKPCVLAIRGYYLDTYGERGENDRQCFDDAVFVVTPESVTPFQFNTDPNGYRKGFGTGKHKGMAMLKKGIHIYGEGNHKGYPAFRQCEKNTVIRDGDPPYTDTGYHAINIHSGGYYSTSSLGCQTCPKTTWNKFKMLLSAALRKFDAPKVKNDWDQLVHSFPYVLVEEVDLRKGEFVVSKRYL